jgi:hypothetical protein
MWSLLLLPGGLAVGHALGYAGAELLGSTPSINGEHGYLGALLCLGLPFALAVVGRAIAAGTRAEQSPVRPSTLAVAQVLAFAAIEITEHARAGIGPIACLRELSFVLGVLAQLVVAWLVCALVRAANRVAAKVSERRRHTIHAAATTSSAGSDVCVSRLAVAVSSLSRRGPPEPRLVF